MVIQFTMSYVLNTGLNAFWSLINAQQNIAYMPIMTVNNPGQVNFYLEVLVEIATFDPIPVDVFYDAIGLWDFQWTAQDPSRDSFTRVGMDRIMVNVLGGVFLVGVLFFGSLMIVRLISCCTDQHRYIKRLHDFLAIDGPLKPIFILFFLETYIDLLMGALINTENDYLFDVPANWGPNGYLNYSDQFTVLLGYFFLVTCIMFPIFVIYILDKKSRKEFMTPGEEIKFDSQFACLYEEFREVKSGFSHYYTVYLMRRIAFVAICFLFWEEHLTFAQVFMNICLSMMFSCYLISYRPFIEPEMNTIQIINEVYYTVISYHQLMFTDFVNDASGKNLVGWSMVCMCLLNLVFPNLYLVIQEMIPDIKEYFA